MNITSAVVAVSLMGIAAPGVAQMATQPMIAQQRATNFSVAESSAVQFAAFNEGKPDLDMKALDKDRCELTDLNDRAFSVKCIEGEGQFKMEAERSFRLDVEPENTYSNPNRQFAWEVPNEHSHVECLSSDPWGVIWYNDHLSAGNLKACIPAPAWNQSRFDASDPDDWLWDLSGYGFGEHPDY
jgi:hypothetical protein